MKTKFLGIIALSAAALNCSCASAQRSNNLGDKMIFNNEYPKQIIFRGEAIKSANDTYENFAYSATYADGFLQKYVPFDEAHNIHPYRTSGFAQRYHEENPDKLVLLHWDAQEHVNNIEESASRYFPGHWYLFEGRNLTQAVSASQTTISVSDAKLFGKMTPNPKARSKWLWPVLLLVELNADGMPIWENYEYVEIENVDIKSSTIDIKRGCALSTPRDFKNGSRVCQVATYLSSTHLFGFNYAANSPRDKDGKQAADVEFEEIVRLFSENERLYGLDGIGFDVLNWVPRFDRERIDSDGDGKADGGFDPITGEDLWRKGAYAFQKRLRDHFGDDFFMGNDSASEIDQRALGIFNGFESEGLVKHNDAYRGFSKTVNIFRYWKEKSPLDYNMCHVVWKMKNPADMKRFAQMQRLCFATTTVLDAVLATKPITAKQSQIPDEILGGSLDKMHWLGKPVAPLRDYALEGENIIEGSDLFTQVSSADCSTEFKGEELVVNGADKESFTRRSHLKWSSIEVPDDVRDIAVIFEIIADEPLKGMDATIPRAVDVKVDGLPAYEGNSNDQFYNNIWCNFDMNSYTQVVCYYRDVAGRTLDFNLDVEGQGGFRVKNLRVNASTQALAREYEHGLVLVNPSHHDFTFNLNEFGDSSYKRLDGSGYPNNGTEIEEEVTVEAIDALFLMKR